MPYRIRCATDLRHSDTTSYIFAVDELGGVASSGYCYTVANAGSAGTTPPAHEEAGNDSKGNDIS